MKVGDEIRTAVALPGIPAGAPGTVKEVGRLFVLVAFADGRQGYYAPRQLTPATASADDGGPHTEQLPLLGIGRAHLPRGSHLCLIPSTEITALGVSARFAAAGLNAGEAVYCAVPKRWQRAFTRSLRDLGVDSDSAATGDRIVMVSPSSLYLPSTRFSGQEQLQRTVAALARASDQNPAGVRALGYVGARYRLGGWWDYERGLTAALQAIGVTTLCVYDRSGWGTESWQLAADTHPHVARDHRLSLGGAALA